MKKAIVMIGLLAAILISGCTYNSDSISQLAIQTSQAREYMTMYPDADVNAVLLSEETISGMIDEIRADCDPSLEAKSYWRVKVSDPEAEVELTIWIDAEKQTPICVVRKGTKPEPPIEPVCKKGDKRCVGDDLEKCKTDGSGWEKIVSCTYGCDSSSNECRPAPICTSDEKRCIGDELEQCNPDGTGWESIESCIWGCSDGACIPPKPGKEISIESVVNDVITIKNTGTNPIDHEEITVYTDGIEENIWSWSIATLEPDQTMQITLYSLCIGKEVRIVSPSNYEEADCVEDAEPGCSGARLGLSNAKVSGDMAYVTLTNSGIITLENITVTPHYGPAGSYNIYLNITLAPDETYEFSFPSKESSIPFIIYSISAKDNDCTIAREAIVAEHL